MGKTQRTDPGTLILRLISLAADTHSVPRSCVAAGQMVWTRPPGVCGTEQITKAVTNCVYGVFVYVRVRVCVCVCYRGVKTQIPVLMIVC